jgi:hypothetical protein
MTEREAPIEHVFDYIEHIFEKITNHNDEMEAYLDQQNNHRKTGLGCHCCMMDEPESPLSREESDYWRKYGAYAL